MIPIRPGTASILKLDHYLSSYSHYYWKEQVRQKVRAFNMSSTLTTKLHFFLHVLRTVKKLLPKKTNKKKKKKKGQTSYKKQTLGGEEFLRPLKPQTSSTKFKAFSGNNMIVPGFDSFLVIRLYHTCEKRPTYMDFVLIYKDELKSKVLLLNTK